MKKILSPRILLRSFFSLFLSAARSRRGEAGGRKILLLLAAFAGLSSAAAGAEIDIQARYLEYDEANKYVLATDSVTVTWGSKVLKADKIEFWTGKELLSAEKNVSLADQNAVIYSDRLTYDYRNEKGDITRPRGLFDQWYFSTDRMRRSGDDNYSAEGLRITNCDLPHPHYTIRAKRAKVVLNKRITIYNAVMYVRNVPVFYVPWWTQGLGKGTKYSLEFQPGYNDTDGFILKTIFGYPLSQYSYGRLYLDYFSVRGWGKGAQFDYFNADKFRGTVYGYQIKEKNTGNEYWNLRAAHWQQLSPLWTTRSDINYVNNVTFNNQYFQDNWQLLNRNISSSLAFTRQSARSNLQISFARNDLFNPLNGNFEPQYITVPGISYTLYSAVPRLPFSNTLNLTFQNQYNKANDYYTMSAFMNANARKGYTLPGRRATFTPSLGVTENWSDHAPLGKKSSLFVTRYYSDLNLRYRLNRYINWDIGYNFKMRSMVNSLLPDLDAADYGEETNQIYFQNYYSYSRLSIRNITSYDFRVGRYELLEDWRQKFSPLVNELTWLPRSFYTVYLREESNLYPHYLRSIQTLLNVGEPDTKYVNLGLFYQYDRSDELGFNVGFGFWPTAKWKIDYRLNAAATGNYTGIRYNDQEIRLYRDLHCWEFKIAYRRRFEAEEITFQLNLKPNFAAKREKLRYMQQEKEFYPWR